MDETGLRGYRVLVVEDEAVIGMMIVAMLGDLGCTAVGPAFRVGEALALIDRGGIDMAIIDLNLGRESSVPVGNALRRHGIPFILATGEGTATELQGFAGVPRLVKPFLFDDLVTALSNLPRP